MSACEECGEPMEQDRSDAGQRGCVECGETWDADDGPNCPTCGRFGHRCTDDGDADE